MHNMYVELFRYLHVDAYQRVKVWNFGKKEVIKLLVPYSMHMTRADGDVTVNLLRQQSSKCQGIPSLSSVSKNSACHI